MQQRNVANLSVAISAGGLSSRMGCDKASLIFQDKPLLQHVLERLSCLSDEIIITTHKKKEFPFLKICGEDTASNKKVSCGKAHLSCSKAHLSCDKERLSRGNVRPYCSQDHLSCSKDYLSCDNVCVVLDAQTQYSSLGGIYTALNSASNDFVAICACDMPFASGKLFQAEYELLAASNADIALPKTEKHYEPFHGVYRRETCLIVAEQLLKQGFYKVSALFDKLQLLELTSEMWAEAGASLETFTNINSPEDIEKLSKI